MSQIALFMQMSGSITGRCDGLRWLKLPRKRLEMLGVTPGLRHLNRGGLRIASTAVRRSEARKPGAANASIGTAR